MWTISDSSNPVHEYTVINDCDMPDTEEFMRLYSSAVRRRRFDYEPTTYDFVPESAPNIYASAQELIERANRDFRFTIDKWQQPLRINDYSVGHSFHWHNDYTGTDNSKLALVYMIQQAEQGGHLQLVSRGKTVQVALKPGQAIVFAAYLQHRVTPIEAGRRIVLAGWATGGLFR